MSISYNNKNIGSDNMNLRDKIKMLRRESGLTQEELGRKLNVTPMTIRNWESGNKNPSTNSVVSLAELFGVTTDCLLGVGPASATTAIDLADSELSLITNYRVLDNYGKKLVDTVCNIEKERVFSQKPIISFKRYIPLYTNPSAAGFSAPLDGDDFEMILIDETIPYNADFAVRIQGNSMSPAISDGAVIYVKRESQLTNGDIGIFSVDGSMYCKQYYIDKVGNLILKSANPDMQSANIYVNADSNIEIKCYGKVLL